MSADDKIDICKRTRRIAADTLKTTLERVLKSKKTVSEVDFRDLWLKELRKHKEIFPDGWYMPPTHGIGVLFGTDNKNGRTNYDNLREKKYLPRRNMLLGKGNNLVYVYASPVDKKTGTIGDFGMSLYFGKNKSVEDHLKQCLSVNRIIFQKIKPGMSFSDIYKLSEIIFRKLKLSNEIISKTDTAVFNIGHSVPCFDDFSNEDKKSIGKIGWTKIKDLLSKKRIFINSLEQKKLEPGMGITMEPRLTITGDNKIPMASYHTIILIKENGEKELLTNFDEIFKLVGMNYML